MTDEKDRKRQVAASLNQPRERLWTHAASDSRATSEDTRPVAPPTMNDAKCDKAGCANPGVERSEGMTVCHRCYGALRQIGFLL